MKLNTSSETQVAQHYELDSKQSTLLCLVLQDTPIFWGVQMLCESPEIGQQTISQAAGNRCVAAGFGDLCNPKSDNSHEVTLKNQGQPTTVQVDVSRILSGGVPSGNQIPISSV